MNQQLINKINNGQIDLDNLDTIPQNFLAIGGVKPNEKSKKRLKRLLSPKKKKRNLKGLEFEGY